MKEVRAMVEESAKSFATCAVDRGQISERVGEWE